MTYLLETYGCEMNKAESAALTALLGERGWGEVDSAQTNCTKQPSLFVPDDLDLVLINTCSVRETAETRAWGRIDHFAAAKKRRIEAGRPPLRIIILGCMAERLKERIKERQPAVDWVLGTFRKQALGLILDAIEQGIEVDEIEESPSYVFSESHHEPGSFRSFVPIMHGCNNFCSYCIVPYVRGREISRSPSSIMAEIESLEDSGSREITLLGQNVNSYRWPGGGQTDMDRSELDFPSLLRLVSSRLRARGRGGIRWIRFLTSHPKDLSDELIRVVSEDRLFCTHIHLCAQSGSNSVLAAMNRRYTREHFLGLVEKMRASIPDLSLSTDILVGFPGETEEDFEATLDLMRKAQFSYSFMYHFNPREGTTAASLPGALPDEIKMNRLSRVIELQKEITRKLMQSRLGSVDDVLIEAVSRRNDHELLARTARDEMLVFPGSASRIGDFARVRLVSLSGNTFRAEEIEDEA